MSIDQIIYSKNSPLLAATRKPPLKELPYTNHGVRKLHFRIQKNKKKINSRH